LLSSASDFALARERWRKNPFVVFEGINGCGKTTQLRLLAQFLERQGTPPLITQEPGGSQLGQQLRSILLNSSEKLDPVAELLLFGADRAQHVSQVIKPALEKGEPVLSDRYYFSTLAFQSYGRGLATQLVTSICEIATYTVKPSVVILIDLPVELAQQRVSSRSAEDRFERERLAFHERVRSGYLRLAKEDPEIPFLLLSGEHGIDEISAQIIKLFEAA
jgi:dTMP kinase